MDAGLVRVVLKCALPALLLFILEIWALCRIAARSDDKLGQR